MTMILQDVLNSLVEKLSIKMPQHYSLCVEHIKSRRRNKLTLLDPKESLSKIASRPGAHNLRCLFRVVFVPKDCTDLLQSDPVTFEYFYSQSCNDIVSERFAPELKYDIALKLAALHCLQHALTNGMMISNGTKVNIKAIEKEFTLRPFIPYTLIETMKSKELHKLLNHYMKQNHSSFCPSGQKTLTSIQAKVQYLKILSELPSYGAKVFPINIRESIIESALLVSRKYGLAHVTGLRNSCPITLARIEDIILIRITSTDEISCNVHVEIHLRSPVSREVPFLRFALDEKDAEELVLTVQGYHKLLLTTATSSSSSQVTSGVSQSSSSTTSSSVLTTATTNSTSLSGVTPSASSLLSSSVSGGNHQLYQNQSSAGAVMSSNSSSGGQPVIDPSLYKDLPVMWDLKDSWGETEHSGNKSYTSCITHLSLLSFDLLIIFHHQRHDDHRVSCAFPSFTHHSTSHTCLSCCTDDLHVDDVTIT